MQLVPLIAPVLQTRDLQQKEIKCFIQDMFLLEAGFVPRYV
jgi:hypothetical protein